MATAAPAAHTEFDPRRNPIRNRNMVRIEIENRKTINLPLPGGTVAPIGRSTMQCYEDEEAAVMACVEQNVAGMAAAQDAFELTIASQVMEKLGWHSTTPEEVRAKIKAGDMDVALREAHENVLKTTGASVEGEFHRIHRRDIRPLVSATVIERDIIEPQRQMIYDERKAQAQVLATALRDANKPEPQQGNNQNQQHNQKR